MPGHKIHDNVTLTVTAVATPALAVGVAHFDGPVALATTAFLLGGLTGLYISPDLDVNTGNYSLTRVWKTMYKVTKYRAFATFAQRFWWYYWRPYAKLFSHRGQSHTPVWGTLVRVIYAAPLLAPVLLLTPIGALYWFAGLCWADLWHTIMDNLDKLLGGRL